MPGRDRRDGRATRWAGQREKRRAEIVAAALTAIAEHGPGVSTEQIAEHAGIARPMLYRHFADADDVYNTVALHIGELLIAELAPTLIRPIGSAREMLTRIIGTYVVWFSQNPSLYQYVISRSMDAQHGGRHLVADVREQISGLLRDLLTGYIVLLQGDPRIADPLSFGLAGLVEAATARWTAVARTPLDRDELIAHLAGWVWGALDAALRDVGVELDPDIPLPQLSERTD
ncbi:TetR/AcrR family transcriptional regulator [Actinocrispum wychmicini]|uniref:TetR/AcrR family transcriptional regulator n=1 Tax=Actinocrispum wychmicini TaxID=1213861 RepID=UPI001FB60089|nr:TetR/AcrR family transcriptional regulator [Actinocrispum wychmicini]